MKLFKQPALIFIFFLALAIRLYRLGSLPFGFHEDEVLTGYVGRFILLNGRDLYNNPWPLLYFNKFGDYYIILPMYIKGLATFLFGVNEFAVRFPSALFGALAIFPVYTLSTWVTRNRTIGLIAAFILMISPWHIVMSRASSEGIIGATIFLYAIVLLIEALEHQSLKSLIVSGLLFFITYFIYHPFRVLTPLVVLPALFLVPHTHKTQPIRAGVFTLFILTLGLTAYISTTPWGSGRFAQTSIFSPLSGVQIKIQETIYDEGTNNIMRAKIFHNKLIGYGREFVRQYLSYFSIDYLFLQGGKSFAYRVPEQGLYLISFIPLLIAGIIYCTKERVNRLYYLYLVLIAPLPAGLTVLDAPNVHRSIVLSLLLPTVFAAGMYYLFRFVYRNISLGHIATVLIAIESFYFWHQYSQHADFFNAIYRNDAQKQLIQYVHTLGDRTPIIMPVQNTMPLYYTFYSNDFDPTLATRFNLDARIDQINNVRFFDDECPSKKLIKTQLPQDTVIVDSHNCEPDLNRYDLVSVVNGRNPLLAYKVLKVRPPLQKQL